MFYFCQASVAETFPELTGIGFAGTIALFPVPEERIANKLNEMNALIPDQEGNIYDVRVICIKFGRRTEKNILDYVAGSNMCVCRKML